MKNYSFVYFNLCYLIEDGKTKDSKLDGSKHSLRVFCQDYLSCKEITDLYNQPS
jgi:hypothetical protein